MRLATPRAFATSLIALATSVFFLCAPAIQFGMTSDFIGPNATEWAVLQSATNLQWTTPACSGPDAGDLGVGPCDGPGWADWSPWFKGDSDTPGARGRKSRALVTLLGLSFAARNAEDAAAGAAKVQQMALTTAGVQLLVLGHLAQQGTILWPTFTTSTETSSTTSHTEDQFNVVGGFA